ncbi:MAG: leucine-rich repeat domain-containing protein [Treponemataceae bacterium]|nr:leucine-rich repeat domain-containing protein [Treponemataceae bacterium]
MKKQTWLAALCAAMMALPFAGCDNGSSEPEEPGVVYKDGWLLAGSTVRQYRGAETSVTTPEGVTRIGEHAFENCTGITEVTIRGGVTVIDDYAFYGCTSLATVTVPASVALIGSGAFSGCALETVRYGGTVGQWCAVDGIGALARAEHVSVGGIEDLNGTAAIEIPDGTKTIAAGAFYYCESLTDVTVPASVTRIGGDAFRGYTALKVLQFNGTTEQWRAIEGCGTVAVPYIQCSDGGVGVQDAPAYLKLYGTKVTGYADGLPENLVIPDGVTEIGEIAFEDCTNLTSVTIGDGMTSIGERAFYNCKSLVSVTIPGSVTSIEWGAFDGCEKLTDVTYNGTLAQWCAMDDHDGNLMYYATSVILTGESNMDLKRAETIDIPASVTEIRYCAFYGCTGLTSVTIPASVTEIGYCAFYGCTGLESVVIPDGVKSIGSSAFSKCTGLTGVEIPASVTEIGDYAFKNCTSLTSVTIPDSVKSIGDDAFSNCTSLATVTYLGTLAQWCAVDNLYFLMNYASYVTMSDGTNLKSLSKLVIPNGVTSIGDGAFKNCTALTSVTIPDGMTNIGGRAFSGCTGITDVTIPAGVTEIGDSAFFGCTNLTDVTIPASVKSIGYSAFNKCTKLATITIPDSVTSIGSNAFSNCTNLAKVTYLGTKEKWNRIEKSWQIFSNNKEITCTDGTFTVDASGNITD